MKLALLLCLGPLVFALSPEDEIRGVLDRQVADWNRGDIAAFMQGYDNSDQTLFIGKNFTRGWREVLQRYRTSYSTREQMGQLTFSDLEVRPLGADYALAIGRFHLTRDAAAGGEAS